MERYIYILTLNLLMKKRLILIFAILIGLIFIISGCEQIKGRNVNRNIADNENAQPIFVCNNNEKRCNIGNECSGSPCVMSCNNNQWIELEYCSYSCSNGKCVNAVNIRNQQVAQAREEDIINFFINEDNFLVINGKPEFIIGAYPFFHGNPAIYQYANSILLIGPHPISLGSNSFNTDGGRFFNQIMLSHYFINEGGNKYFFIMSGASFGGDHGRPVYDIDIVEEILPALNLFSPFFIGWQTREEPFSYNDENLYTLEEMQEIYRDIKSIDPNHPVWLNFAVAHPSDNLNQWIDDVWAYSSAADIISADIYPIPRNPCGPEDEGDYPYCVFENNKISIIGDVVDAMIQATNNEKPVWIVLQGVRTSYIEAKFIFYNAIIHGATGVWFYGQSEVSDGTIQLLNEINIGSGLRSSLAYPTISNKLNTDDGIEFILKEKNSEELIKDYYLFVSNKMNYSKIIQFNINQDIVPKINKFGEEEPIVINVIDNGNSSLEVEERHIFEDYIGGKGVNIYHFTSYSGASVEYQIIG